MTPILRILGILMMLTAGIPATLHGQNIPVVTSAGFNNGVFSMSWTYAGTEVVAVERSTTLLPGSWITIASNIASGTYSDPNTPAPNAFYRLRVEGMAIIPAGTFQMGDAMIPSEGLTNEFPVHAVNVSAFYMDKYEVTKDLWDHVANWAAANGYDINAAAASGKLANHPADFVTWHEAVKWCNARSEKDGLTPCYIVNGGTGPSVYRTGDDNSVVCNFLADGYRLPTEAEWEKASRGGLSGKRFPWGDLITHTEANYVSDALYSFDISATRGNHPSYIGISPYSSPVGSFAPNGYGLYDMVGNQREWCWDWYSDTYYGISPGMDPHGPASGSIRVNRGGSWNNLAFHCRAAYRYDETNPTHNSRNLGFRCARNFAPSGMATIPEGSFQMGNSMDPNEGDPSELPVHVVNVSEFFMDKHEVSKDLWDQVRAWGLTNGYTDLPAGIGKSTNHPVYAINWFDMVKWCNARSEKEGLIPCYSVSSVVYRTGTATPACNFSATGYRLPTEAEWEKAARGGLSSKRFPWGDTITHSQANYYSDSVVFSYDVSPTQGWHPSYNNGSAYTAPVGSFAPNGYGLYDMAGNVYERCWDWFSNSYYGSSPISDPRGPTSGTSRVIRGGDCYSSPNAPRTAFRSFGDPGFNFEVFGGFGFRCSRSSVP